MWSPAVVEVQVAADRSAGLADAVVGVQIHLLIFDAAPKPLDEDIIPPGPSAVHADCNVVVGEHTRARHIKDVKINLTELPIRLKNVDVGVAFRKFIKIFDSIEQSL